MSGDNPQKSTSQPRDASPESGPQSPRGVDASNYQSAEKFRKSVNDDVQGHGFDDVKIERTTPGDHKYEPSATMSQDTGQDSRLNKKMEESSPENTPKAPSPPDGKDKQQPSPSDGGKAPERSEFEATSRDGRNPGDKPADGIAHLENNRTGDYGVSTDVKDTEHGSTTRVVRGTDGSISSITQNPGANDEVSTNYGADGKPTSQTFKGNGTVEYDADGKIKNDTRTDKSNDVVPEPIQKVENPNGSTTYTAPNADGSSQSFMYQPDGNMIANARSDAHGNPRQYDYHADGSLLHEHSETADGRQTDLEFDEKGNQTLDEYRDGSGNHSLNEWSSDGELTRSLQENRDGSSRYSYERATDGTVTTDITANGQSTHQVINPDGSYNKTTTDAAKHTLNYESWSPDKGRTQIDSSPDRYEKQDWDKQGNFLEQRHILIDDYGRSLNQ